MKNYMLLLVTVFLTVTMSVAYAKDGHRGDSHSGGGHHSNGHRGGDHRSGGHRDRGHYLRHHGGNHDGHHRHRSHSSFIFSYGGFYGYPYFDYPYFDYPYSYPARIIVREPAAPVTYIEKSDQDGPYYWYYCTEPKGYYPHIDKCPVGWLQVVPHSPKQ